MKNILYILALCICTCLSGCGSGHEEIAEQYIESHVYFIDNTGKVCSDDISIENFIDKPSDTLYVWQVFEQQDLQYAEDSYKMSIENLTGLRNFKNDMTAEFGDLFDSSVTDVRINEMRYHVICDSIAYFDAKAKYDKLRRENAILAYGYEFDVIINKSGKRKVLHKMIYISDDDKIYKCD